jgi:hypothetical protein
MDCVFSGWSVGWLGGTGRQSSMIDQGTKRLCIALRDGETATGDSERVDTAAYSRLEEEVEEETRDEDEGRDHGWRRDRGGVVGCGRVSHVAWPVLFRVVLQCSAV